MLRKPNLDFSGAAFPKIPKFNDALATLVSLMLICICKNSKTGFKSLFRSQILKLEESFILIIGHFAKIYYV